MTLLAEQIREYAGIIKEDIETIRIVNAFKAYYKGNTNALNNATWDEYCYKSAGGKREFDDKGGLKLQIPDLPAKLKEAGISSTGLTGLKEYVKKVLIDDGILTNQNIRAYDSVFANFAEKLKSNMNAAGTREKTRLKQAN